MPKKSKRISQQKQVSKCPDKLEPNSALASNDYEEYLLAKIDKCQRIVGELSNSQVWQEIKQDYEATAKSLDSVWAQEDILSPKFRQMQITKMATSCFLSLLPNYEHDLRLAQRELERFKNPDKEIKKDFDEEGITGKPLGKTESNQYHG